MQAATPLALRRARWPGEPCQVFAPQRTKLLGTASESWIFLVALAFSSSEALRALALETRPASGWGERAERPVWPHLSRGGPTRSASGNR